MKVQGPTGVAGAAFPGARTLAGVLPDDWLRSRFSKYVSGAPTANGCLLWLGTLNGKGYGLFSIHRFGTVRASRIAWLLVHGPIPPGLVIDHLCRNRRCVNPGHLRVVSNRENVLCGNGSAAVRHRQTECLRGHELSGANVYVGPDGTRECRICKRQRLRAWRSRAKESGT